MCWGKYAMAYDSAREKFYIATQNGELQMFDKKGKWLGWKLLARSGKHAVPQYPHLVMDGNGWLHYAWTSVTPDGDLYYSIHHMLSKDGGATWQNLGGSPVRTSTEADEGGEALLINLPDEFAVHTWLANMMPKEGKVHFMYLAQRPLNRIHYVRYDMATGVREYDSWSDAPEQQWRGRQINLVDYNGWFATDFERPQSPLYFTCRDSDGYVATLVSEDNGVS